MQYQLKSQTKKQICIRLRGTVVGILQKKYKFLRIKLENTSAFKKKLAKIRVRKRRKNFAFENLKTIRFTIKKSLKCFLVLNRF